MLCVSFFFFSSSGFSRFHIHNAARELAAAAVVLVGVCFSIIFPPRLLATLNELNQSSFCLAAEEMASSPNPVELTPDANKAATFDTFVFHS